MEKERNAPFARRADDHEMNDHLKGIQRSISRACLCAGKKARFVLCVWIRGKRECVCLSVWMGGVGGGEGEENAC